jgi:hypothetical protein
MIDLALKRRAVDTEAEVPAQRDMNGICLEQLSRQ